MLTITRRKNGDVEKAYMSIKEHKDINYVFITMWDRANGYTTWAFITNQSVTKDTNYIDLTKIKGGRKIAICHGSIPTLKQHKEAVKDILNTLTEGG